MTGNFGHFMVYAPAQKPEARSYGVVRYGMEVRVGNATSVRVLGGGGAALLHCTRPCECIDSHFRPLCASVSLGARVLPKKGFML